MHTHLPMLLLTCSVAAAGAAAPPPKPELRPAVHKRVHPFPPPEVQLRTNALSRIVNPSHPEPTWLSTTELWVLRIVPFCIAMGVGIVIHSFLLKSRSAQWIKERMFKVLDAVLDLCELLGDPCGEDRRHLIIGVMVTVSCSITAFYASSCAGAAGVVAFCLAYPVVVRFLLLARAPGSWLQGPVQE